MDPTPQPVSELISPSPLPQSVRTQERRKTVRAAPNGLIYISFDQDDNGGIVLNVSEGGLCFSAVAPMKQTGRIRVWFSADSHKIEADCEMAWTDETQRTGGLRFNGLSPAARAQIRNWTKAVGVDRPPEREVPPRTLSVLATAADTNALPDDSPTLEILTPKVRRLRRLGAFSGGLVTGVLLSAILGGVFLFHAYRRQFGEALIRLGEHFGGKALQTAPQASAQVSVPPAATKPQPQTLSSAPAPAVVPPHGLKPQLPIEPPPAPPKPPAQAIQPRVQTATAVPSPIPAPARERLPSAPVTEKVKAQAPRLESVAPPNAISTSALTPTSPTTPTAPTSAPVADKTGKPMQPGSALPGEIHVQQLGAENQPSRSPDDFVDLRAGIPLGKYLDLGKFRDPPEANKAANGVAQAGFHAVVALTAGLWTKSYHVLAGPYGNDHEAELAHRNLKSKGFTPRNLTKKSRSLTLFSSKTRVDGMLSPLGDVVVSWEPYSADATVQFVKDDMVVTAVKGKWVNRDAPFLQNAIVYWMADHGSRTLLEIQFSGARQALVLADNTRKIVF